MKQTKFLAMLLFAGVAITACDDDDDFNPNPDVVADTMTLTFEESNWDALIDDPQNNGPLLYGENAKNYAWTDATTQLHGGMTNAYGGNYGFAESGIAISNYVDENSDSIRSYDIQLAVPVSNGSKNFAVVYCSDGATLSFADGVAREVASFDVIPTTYVLSVIKNGNEYAKALTARGDYLSVVVTGYNGETQTGVSKIVLALDGGKLTKWYTHSLSALGKVTSLHFTMEGSDASSWGLNTPAYFAFDNVVVKK